MPTYTRSPPLRWWSGRSVRAEPDKRLFGGEPQDSGSSARRLGTGSKPNSVDARRPLAPPFIPPEGEALFLADYKSLASGRPNDSPSRRKFQISPTCCLRCPGNWECALAEGWCLSAMEVAASGVPTIGYDLQGLNEFVSQGVSGLLIKSGNMGDLAGATKWNLSRSGDWSDSPRKYACRSSWHKTQQSWESLLLHTCGESS